MVTLTDASDPEVRRSGIGGSDVAAIVGLNRFRAPLDVYLAKKGLVEDSDSEAAEWGRILEPVILRQYAIRMGAAVLCRDENGEPTIYMPDGLEALWTTVERAPIELLDTVRDPNRPWRMCHPDGFVLEEETLRPIRQIEGKTTSAFRGKEWGDAETDDVPEEYHVQCTHNAGVVGASSGLYLPVDIPVLIGGQTFRVYTVNYRRSLDEKLVELESAFWEQLQAGIAPPPTGDKRGANALQVLYPDDDGEERIVDPDDDLNVEAARLREAREGLKNAEATKMQHENTLKAAMGACSKLIGDGWSISWKKAKDTVGVDYEAAFSALTSALPVDYLDLVEKTKQDNTRTLKRGSRRFLPRFAESEE